MASTYEPIATTTLGTAAASITFSSISSAYTDLRLVFVGGTSTATLEMWFRVNSDTGTNYSQTNLYGNGATAASNRTSNANYIVLSSTAPGTPVEFVTVDLFSYAGSTYKTVLVTDSNDKNGSGFVYRNAGLWRSTSAITSVTVLSEAGNLVAGTTATLYGILKA
jgi:hypothetical protein